MVLGSGNTTQCTVLAKLRQFSDRQQARAESQRLENWHIGNATSIRGVDRGILRSMINM